MKNNPKEYTNHSGGAKGADMEWDRIGRIYGVENHIHYKPADLKSLSREEEKLMLRDVYCSAQVLKRPHDFKGIELVHRNWLQINRGSTAIYAISCIINPNEVDFKGFENKTGKQIVAGGTGWAVEMAIQKDIDVNVYDVNTNQWYLWMDLTNSFEYESVPLLTKQFTGIGSRNLTSQGIQAIVDVYEKNF